MKCDAGKNNNVINFSGGTFYLLITTNYPDNSSFIANRIYKTLTNQLNRMTITYESNSKKDQSSLSLF